MDRKENKIRITQRQEMYQKNDIKNKGEETDRDRDV